jgi:hypothetical protein
VELPGVYFALNNALFDPASDHALAQVAAALEPAQFRFTVPTR